MSLLKPISITINENAVFRAICETLVPFSDEMSWVTIKNDMLFIQCMSGDHISMATYSVPMERLKPYTLPKDNVSFPIPLRRVVRILKNRKQKEFTLEWHKDKKKTEIVLRFKKPKRTVKVPIIPIAKEVYPDTNKLSLSTVLMVDPNFFYDMLKDSDIIGNHIHIVTTDNTIDFSTYSDDMDYNNHVDLNKKVEPESEIAAIKEMKDKTDAWYPIPPLLKLFKKAALFDHTTIKYENDMPILVQLLIKKDFGGIIFFTAPYVPGDEAEEPVLDNKEEKNKNETDNDEEIDDMLNDLEGEEDEK